MRNSRALVLVFVTLVLCTACTNLKRAAYEGFSRDEWQQPGRVIQTLNIKAGEQIADLGAGSGYFTFRLAEATGAEGIVYAIDVDAPMLELIGSNIKERGAKNVRTILGTHDDPKLPATGVDLIFVCNTYHHMENRAEYFKRVKQFLRPGGRVAILDFKDHGEFAGMIGHATHSNIVRKEMEQAGYRLQNEYDFLEKQNFQIFTLP
jgi:ubiquinone/menaquinone biosynthesis C-methylase UbiE